MEEIWKDIPEYEGLYQISNIGNIKAKARAKTHKKDKIMIPTIKKYGYKEIGFMKKGIRKMVTESLLNIHKYKEGNKKTTAEQTIINEV